MSISLSIIGGQFRGRPLKAPRGNKTRPTTALLRKSVFDICMYIIEDARVLDVCAGSGAIGFEALSRGAVHVTFIEDNKDALAAIHQNIELLKVNQQCTIIQHDAQKAIKKLKDSLKQYDLIYIDPPYHQTELTHSLLKLIDDARLLAQGGILFVEEAMPSVLKPEKMSFAHLALKDSRHFGKALLHQFLSPGS
jgi:16S rRNA (guanine966-N2)-methyltransferase